MKFLIAFLLIFSVSVWIGLGLHHDPGMMVIMLAGWRMDLPLWLGLVALVLIYAGVQGVLCFFSSILLCLRFFGGLFGKWRKKLAIHRMERGLLALEEGRFQKAEKLLISSAPWSKTPWLNYLSAAKAAQALNKIEKRDFYLKTALQKAPNAKMAVNITKASLQYSDHQYDHSLLTLKELQQQAPKHPSVLKLLEKVYYHLQDWDNLLLLLPKLKHHEVLTTKTQEEFEIQVYQQWLLKHKNTDENISDYWHKIPKKFRYHPEISNIYILALIQDAKFSEAQKVLDHALLMHWDEKLVRLYVYIEHPYPQKLINTVESWLDSHEHSPSLMFALGSLCEQQALWGKAQRYFEASLSLLPDPEVYRSLGALLEKMSKPELAAHYFKKGLESAAEQKNSPKPGLDVEDNP